VQNLDAKNIRGLSESEVATRLEREGFNYLHPSDILICVGAGIVSIIWFEILKALKLVQR
jgi:hypothetical protein